MIKRQLLFIIVLLFISSNCEKENVIETEFMKLGQGSWYGHLEEDKNTEYVA